MFGAFDGSVGGFANGAAGDVDVFGAAEVGLLAKKFAEEAHRNRRNRESQARPFAAS